MAVFKHNVWLFEVGADVRLIVASGFTVIVPLADAGPQDPVAVTVKLNDPVTEGVPLIVKTPAL